MKKYALNTRLMYGLRKARTLLKANGIKYGGIHDVIEKVRIFRGIEPFVLPKKQRNKWMAEYFHSGQDEFIKKNEPLNLYLSDEWIKLRKLVFKKYGKSCMKCGSNESPQVDHIKPYSLFPELFLNIDNLQVLCKSCNASKSNRNSIDYRKITK